ncbi:MAG: hypothetical protein HY301_16540 [Verrucomicrobia bacterium]|nr:hypothetical protein [Verrucomicrobiota bacterium]
MRALKHICGILLATAGVALVLGGIAQMLDPKLDAPWWLIVLILWLPGLLFLGGAVLLLRRSATDLPPTCCPKCGGVERAPAGVLTRSSNPWIMYLGGWLLASFWGASRQQQVRCVQCDNLYFTETRGTRIAGILLWVFLLLLLLGSIAERMGTE